MQINNKQAPNSRSTIDWACCELLARMALFARKLAKPTRTTTCDRTIVVCQLLVRTSSNKSANRNKNNACDLNLMPTLPSALRLFILFILIILATFNGVKINQALATTNQTIHIVNRLHGGPLLDQPINRRPPLSGIDQLPAHYQPASVFTAQNRSINLTHVCLDELTQSVYVGATDWLLQLSAANLRPEVALRTGPAGFAQQAAESQLSAQTNHRDCAPADCQAQLAQVDLDWLHQQALIGHRSSAQLTGDEQLNQRRPSHSLQFGGAANRARAPQQVAASGATTQVVGSAQLAAAPQPPQHNYNKILAIDANSRQLLVCGSLSQGACRRHQLGRLGNFSEPIPTAVASNDEQSTTVALVVGAQAAKQPVLYVGATNSRFGPFRDMVPAISARYLDVQSGPGRPLQIIDHGFDYAKIDISFELRDYYLVNYVHAFQHNDFVYFATVQRKSPLRQLEEWGYITRLARLCLSDLSFQSYAEMTLECRNAQGRNYNLLQDAHLAQVGAKQAPVLVGAFAQSRDHTTRSARHSALCLFPMDKVEHYFNENIQLCYNGTAKSRNMNYIAGSVSECPRPGRAQLNNAANYCNEPIKLNGSLALSAQPIVAYDQELLTSVQSTLALTAPLPARGHQQQQQQAARHHQVLVAGTSEGQLKRIVVLGQGDEARAIEFDSLQLEESAGCSLASQADGGANCAAVLQDLLLLPALNPQLDSSGAGQQAGGARRHQYALAATQNKLFKVRVNACKAVQRAAAQTAHLNASALVDQCTECAQLQDPFCGWCAHTGSCVARDDCLQQAAGGGGGGGGGNSLGAHWVPFDQIKCHHYEPIAPDYLPLEQTQPSEQHGHQSVEVNVRLAPEASQRARNLHQLGAQLASAQFSCHFDYLAHWPQPLASAAAAAASVNASQPRPAGATTKAAQARLNVQAQTVAIGCQLPGANQRPAPPTSSGELRVKLSVRLASEGLEQVEQALQLQATPKQQADIERELTLYSCRAHADCRACLRAGAAPIGRRARRYACAWCPLSNRCTFNASSADFGCAASAVASTTPNSAPIRGSHLTASLDRAQASVLGLAIERLAQCPATGASNWLQAEHSAATSGHLSASEQPALVAGQAEQAEQANRAHQAEILVAHNTRRALQLPLRQAASAWLARDKRVLKLECLLELEGSKARYSARLVDSQQQQVLCQEILFAYQAEQATQKAQLRVLLNDVQVIESSEVILYKCHLFGVSPPALASSAAQLLGANGAQQHKLHYSSSAAWRAHELFQLVQQKPAIVMGQQERARQSDCSLCANIERKFQCAWCANQCLFRDHCTELAASSCPPPRIDSIHPSSGPLDGGTLLTIEGSNLGSNEREIQDKISVGGQACQLLMYSVSTRIVCKTSASLLGPQAATVFVGNRVGVTSAFEKFHYKAVHLTDVTPRMGPMSGGTRLFLTGSNLNVGSRIQVHLDDIPCLVDSDEISSNQISCVTSANLVTHSMRITRLALTIDNSTHYLPYPFTYQPDPIITQIEPSESFLSGGRLILVTGHHLASPQTTKLMLYHENKNNIINGTTCITQNDTLITCLTPAISPEVATNLIMQNLDNGQQSAIGASDNNNDASSQAYLSQELAYDQGLRLRMMFLMDDVKSVRNLDEYYHHLPHFMTYFNDPKLFKLPTQLVEFVEEDNLVIAGENLKMKQLDQDMLITIGIHICPIKSVLPNQVICEPPSKIAHVKDENGRLLERPQLPIVALIGSNLRFQLGHMQYSSRHYQQMVASELGSSSLNNNYISTLASMHHNQPARSASNFDYTAGNSDGSSASLLVLVIFSGFGFVIAFAVTFFFAVARFRQSKAEREYKRIQLQMGALDMNPEQAGNVNNLIHNKIHMRNGTGLFQHQSDQQTGNKKQNLSSRALDYVGGALSGSFASTQGKVSKPFYQFTSQHAPPLPSFPPSPLTDISSLIGASPAHVNQHFQHQQQQHHVVKLNSDGTIMNATANNHNHYSLYGVGNTTAASSSSKSSSPGQNMFTNNNKGNHQQSNASSRNYNWTQEAPSTIVPYAVIEACNLTLEGKNAIKEYV